MIDAATVFWWALGILAYTWFGYPVLLAVMERIFYRPVRRQPQTPPVTFLVTVYNEEHAIAAKLDNLLALDYPPEARRIVVASDGSTDRTEAIVADYASRGVILHAHPSRRGKAAVLNDEVLRCETELVVLCDARQRVASDALRRIVANFADPDVGAVSGELVLEEAGGGGIGRGMGFYWRFEKFLRTRESAIHSSVGATGALLALRRYLWRGLPDNTILDDMVFPFQVVQQGYRVILESGALVYDRPNETWEREFVRKTRTLAGNFQTLFHPVAMAVPLFGRFAFQYLSHKVLRLFGPLLLLLMFWGNYWAARLAQDATEQLLYGALLWGQAAFYAACLIGFAAERLRLHVPFVSVPYSFFVTQIAIVCGFLRFGSGRDSGAWDKVSHLQEDGQMQPRLMRLLFDSTLYCLGIIASFRLMKAPESLFQSFADLNPHFMRYGVDMSVPLVILVPLTILYFFRVNEASARLTGESFLNIVKGVFHSTLVMLVLMYMVRGQVTRTTDYGITSLLPTKVLALSFVLNIALLAGWRALAGWLLALRASTEAERHGTLVVEHALGATSGAVMGAPLDAGTLTGCIVDAETFAPAPGKSNRAFAELLDRDEAAEVCVACGKLGREETLGILNMVEREGWKACFLPTELEMLLGTSSLSLICYIPVLDITGSRLREFDAFCKRLIDVLLGAGMMLCGLPAFVAARHARGAAAFVPVRRAGQGGRIFTLLRPAGRAWWTRGARRFFLGRALVRGDLAAVGQSSLSVRVAEQLTAFERSLLRHRPGLTGPRGIRLAGMGHLRRALFPALLYARLVSLQFDAQYLPLLFRRRGRMTTRMSEKGRIPTPDT